MIYLETSCLLHFKAPLDAQLIKQDRFVYRLAVDHSYLEESILFHFKALFAAQ